MKTYLRLKKNKKGIGNQKPNRNEKKKSISKRTVAIPRRTVAIPKRTVAILSLTIILSTVILSSCKKKDVATLPKDANIGQFQHEVKVEASEQLAKEYNIDASEEKVMEFVEEATGGTEALPQDIYEMPNNPNIIKTLLGDKGLYQTYLPAYVENELERLFTEDEELAIGHEEIKAEAEKMKDYLDSLGIAEEDRMSYIEKIIRQQDVQTAVENVISIKYAQVIGKYLDNVDPMYVKSLQFNIKNLDSSKGAMMNRGTSEDVLDNNNNNDYQDNNNDDE